MAKNLVLLAHEYSKTGLKSPLGGDLEGLVSGFYYYSDRYYNPNGAPMFISPDRMQDLYPHVSPYCYTLNNPLRFIDPTGMTVEPTTDEAKAEIDKYTNPSSKSYQPAFAKMYNTWKESKEYNVKFTTVNLEGAGSKGTVTYDGEINGMPNYNVIWDPNAAEQLGTSAIFEESKHLFDGLNDGKFDLKNNNAGFTIDNEVEAKKWITDNIKKISPTYLDDGYLKQTHYGYFKNNPQLLTPENLANGLELRARSMRVGGAELKYFLFGTGAESYKKLLWLRDRNK